MNGNITTITHVLKKEFPNRAVQHQFANDLHTFRLYGETEVYWLHVARELVDQSDVKSVCHLLSLYSAADALLASPTSKWLFLDNSGVHEVDEGFAN